MGRRTAALIDPGPDTEEHVRTLVDWMSGVPNVVILLTHGHGDHAGAARAVADALHAPVRGPAGLDLVERPLADGDSVDTDEGTLVAISTPGHTREHLSYLWEPRRALFAGDFLLGRGDTTWVAGYAGCVADYLASLDRVRSIDPSVIYPAHGPPLENPRETLDRFEAHRRARIRAVESALAVDPDATPEGLVATVYGPDLPPGLERAALQSLEALVEHVRRSSGI